MPERIGMKSSELHLSECVIVLNLMIRKKKRPYLDYDRFLNFGFKMKRIFVI